MNEEQRKVLLQKLAQLGSRYRSMRLGQLPVWLNGNAADDVTRSMADLDDDALLRVVERKLAFGQSPPSDCPPEDQYRSELLGELETLGQRCPTRSLAGLVFHLAAQDGGDEYGIEDQRLLSLARSEQGIGVG